ncbi:MAG: hypothetical protein ACREHD_13575 [Pirellulales bacterium]
MTSLKTSATVEEQGRVYVAGVPFAPGTEVEVAISPKRGSADDFSPAWRRVCTFFRSRPQLQNVTDDIREETAAAPVNERADRAEREKHAHTILRR